jgi:hypothetical protein
MKRFTETAKWDDPWFRRLPPEMKLLWAWLLDRCDNAGIIDPDLELASFQIGYQYPIDTLSKLDGRVIQIACGKWFIPKFITFQYGELSHECRAHKPIFQSLEKHSIDAKQLHLKGYPKGINTLQEKEKEKEKDTHAHASARQTKSRATLDEVVEFTRSIQLPDTDAHATFYKWEGNAWTNNGKPIKDWKATIRSWKAGGFLPSQKNGVKPAQVLPSGELFQPLFAGHDPTK